MKTEQEFQQRLAQLPDSISPQRDLWPELAVKLAQTPQQTVPLGSVDKAQTYTGWWLAAASVALLTVWSPWQYRTDQPIVAQQEPAASYNDSSDHVAGFKSDPVYQHGFAGERVHASSETQWRLRSEFEQQRALQLAQIQQVPDIYQDWKQQLQIWKQATSLVLLALQYQPDEPGLLRQLSKLQQQELAYIQKVVQADQT